MQQNGLNFSQIYAQLRRLYSDFTPSSERLILCSGNTIKLPQFPSEVELTRENDVLCVEM